MLSVGMTRDMQETMIKLQWVSGWYTEGNRRFQLAGFMKLGLKHKQTYGE